MSLALHGHHVLLSATLVFAAAVLTPYWYTNSNNDSINVFQLCSNSSVPQACQWTFTVPPNNSIIGNIKIIYPILIASFAIACAGLSFIALLLGSWYIQQHAGDNSAKCLLVSTIITTLLSFLLSCGVWAIMLTTNLQQKSFGIPNVRLQDFGFSFWINIGSSSTYLYALIIYLIAACQG